MAPDRAERRIFWSRALVVAFLVASSQLGVALKIFAYDLPQWKDETKFGDSSRFKDIR